MVGQGANLNYEAKSYYDLQLTVSDSLDTVGDTDASVDDTIDLRINITDVAGETMSVTLSAQYPSQLVNNTVELTAAVATPPVGTWTYHGLKKCDASDVCSTDTFISGATNDVSESTAGVMKYTMIVTYTDSANQTVTVNSNEVSVTWRDPPNN